MILTEQIFNEVLKRMKQIDLFQEAIDNFKNSKEIYKSERTKILGLTSGELTIGKILTLSDEQKHSVAEFEKKYNSFVYHIIETNTQFGLLNDFLYVSSNQDEWELEREDLAYKTPCIYCLNTIEPDFSEFGSIAIESRGGGLIRIS